MTFLRRALIIRPVFQDTTACMSIEVNVPPLFGGLHVIRFLHAAFNAPVVYYYYGDSRAFYGSDTCFNQLRSSNVAGSGWFGRNLS